MASDTVYKETANSFSYDIGFPEGEHTCKITITKEMVVVYLSSKLGRKLTEQEGQEMWDTLKQSREWYSLFPEYAMAHGYRMYGVSDYDTYVDLFKDDIQEAIDQVVEKVMAKQLEYIFHLTLEEMEGKLREIPPSEEKITLNNIEQQTQKRIQEENVKNGLARCANETKKKSIEKWKAHYIQTHMQMNVDESILPKGKTKEDLFQHMASFF
jgi:hypothetical protein